MKRTLTLFLGLLSVVLLFGNNTAHFEQGIKAFKAKEYKEAEAFFLKILDSGSYSFELYYNLGNTYFELDDLGKSRLYYEKALKIEPNHQDALKNIALLKLKLKDEIEPIAPFFVTEIWDGFVELFKTSIWFAITMLFLCGTVGLFLFVLYDKLLLNKTILIFLVFGTFCFVTSLIFTFASHNNTVRTDEAIILADQVSLLEGADERAPVLRELHEGTKVAVLDKLQGWIKVKLEDGDSGWLKLESLVVY